MLVVVHLYQRVVAAFVHDHLVAAYHLSVEVHLPYAYLVISNPMVEDLYGVAQEVGVDHQVH